MEDGAGDVAIAATAREKPRLGTTQLQGCYEAAQSACLPRTGLRLPPTSMPASLQDNSFDWHSISPYLPTIHDHPVHSQSHLRSQPHHDPNALSIPFSVQPPTHYSYSFTDPMNETISAGLPIHNPLGVPSNQYTYAQTDLTNIHHMLEMPITDAGLLPESNTLGSPYHDENTELHSPESVRSLLDPPRNSVLAIPRWTPARYKTSRPRPPSTSALARKSTPRCQPSSRPGRADDQMLSFDATTHSFPKRAKANQSEPDPYAAAFLQDQIGDDKWRIFAARLYERRLGGTKARYRGKKALDAHDGRGSGSGANAIEFLVKVEVVKEVLRIYVPHPYNPFKSLTHPYEGSPSGHVTLTRATVLKLSGWSNTQFSYWARRAEAISVLASHDARLHEVALALERRLRVRTDPPEIVGANYHTWPSPSSPLSPLTSPLSSTSGISGSGSTDSPPPDPQEPNVTGKGLDQLIDAVKRRTGASPFLRGKHASLDPFGAKGVDKDAVHAPTPVYTPTFQAQMYTHEAPASSSTAPGGREAEAREAQGE
ncbi:hypothetical protein EVG20_g11542 [Dentipellis fragilis]|uniref:Uncharacterized protein n=1 Tax=Dentipellis fragilis TaxID=205917 RepID=A0A4Y9XM37_9AGAM|nr:hypothetical protein EVG20_g11542 [Dentipellis fragilis]